MLPQNLPDFDALWDYSHPDQTETRFREVLLHFPEEDPVFLELLTQIARAQGLQRKFEQAHRTLDQVERRLEELPSRARVRYLLERGRVFNSSGETEPARPLFERALELASRLGEDFYAIDALHMLAIVAPLEQGLELNRRAIQFAESSPNERAQGWLGSLYNNTGWSYHDLGNYSAALEVFQKGEAWRRARGQLNQARIAAWCVGRALRSLQRLEEALARQVILKQEYDSAGESDGYVLEEIGECLLALERSEEARPYFRQAYEMLAQDPWFVESETERLARLKVLAGDQP